MTDAPAQLQQALDDILARGVTGIDLAKELALLHPLAAECEAVGVTGSRGTSPED